MSNFVILSAAIVILAHQPQYAPSSKLGAEKAGNSNCIKRLPQSQYEPAAECAKLRAVNEKATKY